MKTPIIMINVKTYSEGSGDKVLALTQLCESIAKDTNKSIALCVEAADIKECSKLNIPILAQHIDPIEPGNHTGFILAEDIKQAGAIGTLLNHSEHRIDKDELEQTINRAKENNLLVVLCAKDANEAKDLAVLNPEFIAIEPPELIGGDVSVTTRPELIKDSISKIKSINKDIQVLVGAGVKNSNDVKIAIELGADGILIASGVVKSKNQKQIIEDLVSVL